MSENAQGPTSTQQNLRVRIDAVVSRLQNIRGSLQDILTKVHGSSPPPPSPASPATINMVSPIATGIGDAHQVLNVIEKLIDEIKGDL
jgi:hypothetical protein